MEVLAVDGGQSRVRVGHSQVARVVEIEGISRQDGDVIARTADAVAEGWRQLGSPPVARAVLGLTTAPAHPSDADRLSDMLAGSTRASEVWVTDDSVTNHAGAFAGRPGVSVAVGTGVCCLAVSNDGKARSFSGHGYLLGDEGGGYWIGRAGLNAVFRHREGRGAVTALATVAQRRFGDLADLHVRLHDAARPVDTIAQFAPDVLALADTDEVASSIVDYAAAELFDVVRAALAYAGSLEIELALGGRLVAAESPLRERLLRRLREDGLPDPIEPAGTALDGALKLGENGHAGPYAQLIHRWRGPK